MAYIAKNNKKNNWFLYIFGTSASFGCCVVGMICISLRQKPQLSVACMSHGEKCGNRLFGERYEGEWRARIAKEASLVKTIAVRDITPCPTLWARGMF